MVASGLEGWDAVLRLAHHLDGQDELHDLIDQYQEALKPFPTLDPIPREWRHITLQGLGHVEEVTDSQRDAAVEAVAARLSTLAPIETAFDRAVIFREAIALKPSDPEAFAELRRAIRAGIADAWGFSPEKADGFRAHVSVAYSNGPTASLPIRRALNVAQSAAMAALRQVSLIRMNRDRRMYVWETVRELDITHGP